jgi:hypothetical protein
LLLHLRKLLTQANEFGLDLCLGHDLWLPGITSADGSFVLVTYSRNPVHDRFVRAEP